MLATLLESPALGLGLASFAREILELPELYDPPPPGIVVEPSHDPVTGDRLTWVFSGGCVTQNYVKAS